MVDLPATHPSNPWLPRLRILGAAILAGLLLSLPIGLLNRLFMRVSALMGGETLGFSWGGTLGVLIVTSVLIGPISGLLYLLLRRLAPGRASLLSGALLVLLLGIPFLVAAPNGLNTIGNRLVNQIMYGSLFLAQGLGVVPMSRWLERRLPQGRQWPVGALLSYGLLSLFGIGLLLLGLVVVLAQGFGGES